MRYINCIVEMAALGTGVSVHSESHVSLKLLVFILLFLLNSGLLTLMHENLSVRLHAKLSRATVMAK